MKKKISSLFCGVASIAMLISVVIFVSCGEDDTSGSDGGGEGADEEIVVSDDYLPLEDYKYSVESADTTAGVYALAFEEGTPTIPAGTVMQIDMDSIVKLVRVVAVEDAGGNVKLTTQPADLCDIFISGSFTLSTEGMAEAKTRGAGKNGNVFYPSSITFYDENDRKHTVDLTDGTRGGFERRLYSQSIDLSGLTFAETAHTRTYLETCTFDFNLDLIMEYNFEEAKEGWNKYRRGELVLYKSAVRGSLDTDFKIRFDAQGEASEQFDEICLKRNIHKPVTARFQVGPVPVVVVMNTNLYADGSYGASGSFSAHTGFATSTDVELGFSWAQSGQLNPYADFNSGFTWHKPTVEGSAHLEGKVSVFPRINFAVYGVLGPGFDIKPYLRQTLDLGFYDQLGSSPKDFYGAGYNMFTGYDAAVSLTLVPSINTETLVKSPAWNVLDKQLYNGPAKLEYVGKYFSEVKPKKNYRLDFSVRDLNLLASNEALPVLPWPVKFVTNCGSLSSDFVTTDCFTGLASVDWTPSSSTTDGADPYVVAIIHNNEGREIATDRITAKFMESHACPDDNHPHAIDLGLPSGTLWACCNVGASSPEGYGDYFAWGETTTKSTYYWDNYKWCNCEEENPEIANEFTKYCMNSNYGTIDNKTELEAEDDAATVNWGTSWRMPTLDEISELCSECNWTWITQNGVNGNKVIGPNGNYIFLPAAGFRGGSIDVITEYVGTDGYYWSSSLTREESPFNYPHDACFLKFRFNYYDFSVYSRRHGFTVRAVNR